MTAPALVQKLWNYCNILRDDGLSYGDYVEQLSVIITLFVLVALLAAAAAILKLKGGANAEAKGDPGMYELRKSIFTPAERSFLSVLESSLPVGVDIFAKVRLGDIFKTKQGLPPSDRTRANNRINQKHVDFLLVRTSDLAPVAGVELDDGSHERDDRQRRVRRRCFQIQQPPPPPHFRPGDIQRGRAPRPASGHHFKPSKRIRLFVTAKRKAVAEGDAL